MPIGRKSLDFPEIEVYDGVSHSGYIGKLRLAGKLRFEKVPD